MGIKELLENRVVIFDGAMGTMLQSRGLKGGDLPEILNLEKPREIQQIHEIYLDAGADIVTTNTFGANERKLAGSGVTVEEVVDAAVRNAKNAVSSFGGTRFVALDMGPIGELLAPMGTLSFEEAYEIFQRQVVQGVKSGVDLILVETMTDLYEAKASVLAAKENSELPVVCTMTFEANGRTFTGCTPEAMVLTLEGLGVDAIGVNCSLGPKELSDVIERVLAAASVPVFVQPNAGIPVVVEGATVFPCGAEEFGSVVAGFIERGVRMVGGCCGTTPEHIRRLSAVPVAPKLARNKNGGLALCTPSRVVAVDEVKVIGERINPTGKKRFKEALVQGDVDYILREAIAQVEAGADILDVNVGMPEIDEVAMMRRVVPEIQSVVSVPLMIDSSNPDAIEAALRVYNGKAIVNSVNGEMTSLQRILPIVKKYGAAVVGLTLDEKGIPETAEGRYEIAERIVLAAEDLGIPRSDVVIDCLTLTVAAKQSEALETIRAVQMVNAGLGVKTVLGVSNVSFGLPNRGLINQNFLSACLMAGLDLPILNPMQREMMDAVRVARLLRNEDVGGARYIECYHQASAPKVEVVDGKSDDLYFIILKGVRGEAAAVTKSLLVDSEPLRVVEEHIIPALDVVGARYESGEIFLPQLIRSAETVKEAFEVVKSALGSGESISKGKVLLATVKGDIHDIGKNIVKVLLENYGFQVVDLGKDVPVERVVSMAVDQNIRLIGLSALMTTTVKSMEETIVALRAANHDCKVVVGGAVLTADYAQMIGADFYGRDAMDTVGIAQEFFSKEGHIS